MINQIHNLDYIELLWKVDFQVDLVLSDPPFGISYQNNYTHKKHKVLAGDNGKFSYQQFAEHSFRILKHNSAIFAFTGWSEYPEHYKHIEEAGFIMKEPLIGQKRPAGTSDLYGSFQSNSDWLIFAHKGRFKFKKTELLKNKRAGTIPNKGRKAVPDFKTRFPSCWFGDEFPWSSENSSYQKKNEIYHPTIKGLEFTKWIIQMSTNEGDTVVDPFCGTGTVALACKQLKRNFICGDVDPEYCKMAEKRLSLNV